MSYELRHHKHVHRIVNCIEQLTVNFKLSNSGISLNLPNTDEVTTSDCTILLVFGYLCFTRQCSDIISVVCMPQSRKFLTESTGVKIMKIGQYLAKIWTKYNSLVFWPTLYVTLFAVCTEVEIYNAATMSMVFEFFLFYLT